MLPIVALDIDGVLAPIGGSSGVTTEMEEAWPKEAWSTTPSNFNLRVAQPVIDFFVKLHENHRAQIFWHTTWRESAQGKFASELGLPHWEVLENAVNYHSSPGWWKWDDVVLRLEAGHRVIWIDDDIDDSEEVRLGDWFDSPSLHAICPSLLTGITASHLTEIEKQLTLWQ